MIISTHQKCSAICITKACSNSGAKILRYSANEIWLQIPLKLKNKPCWRFYNRI